MPTSSEALQVPTFRPHAAAVVYALIGAAWILLSDWLLVGAVFEGPPRINLVQSAKGLLFVGASALAIFLLISAATRRARAAQGRLETIVRHSPHAILAVDGDARVTLWNPAAERIFGWTAAEVLGRQLPTVDEATRHETEEILARVLAGGSVQDREVTRRRKDGSTVEILLSVVRIESEEAVPWAVGVCTDVSALRQLQRDLHRSERLQTIGKLSAGIAHDFNNLLTAIRGNAELALADGSEGDRRERVQDVIAASDSATDLVGQLLAFGRGGGRAAPADVGLTVRGATSLLARVLGDGVSLVTELDPQPLRVDVEPVRLEQAVVNLAVNARDAMPEGGRLTIATRREDGRVRLTVSDTGVGIAPEELEHVFEPFYSTKSEDGGTGLGLASVRALAEEAGGSVEIASERDAGTTVELLLPLTARREGACTTVAVVEEDASVRTLVAEYLRQLDFRVLETAELDEAVLWAGRQEPRVDVAVCDAGTAAAQPGRAVELQALVPTILLGEGARDGYAQALQRPFDPSELADAIRVAAR